MSEVVHRKLSNTDYSIMRWEAGNNFTIREIAGNSSCSTKFVNRVLQAKVWFDSSGGSHFILAPEHTEGITVGVGSTWNCISGCHRYFSTSTDLEWHIGFYTASGTTSLSCSTVMPG